MKVLQTVEHSDANQHIYLLTQHLKKHTHVTSSTKVFFHDDVDYNVIHIHWPEALFGWRLPYMEDFILIKERLAVWKKKAAIVYTLHNSQAHELHNPWCVMIYKAVYEAADVIIHLGSHSYNKKVKNADNRQHVIIPRGLYKVKNKLSNQRQARDLLSLSLESFVILVFGRIRNQKERNFIWQTFKMVNKENKFLLVPRWHEGTYPSWKTQPLQRIRSISLSFRASRYPNMCLGKGTIAESNIERYFKASDIVLLPRENQLNSGVPFLAYSYGKQVVAYGKGSNMQNIVRQPNKFCFHNYEPTEAATVINNLRDDDIKTIPNLKDFMTWEEIAEKTYTTYQSAVRDEIQK